MMTTLALVAGDIIIMDKITQFTVYDNGDLFGYSTVNT